MNNKENNVDLYTLHLFAGGGGGIYADLLLGHKPIGAVEIEPNAREMLLKRQLTGEFPRFPIWDDIRTFRIDNEFTKPFIERCINTRHKLIISGGFPCQDISTANRRAKGLEGEKSGLWWEMHRVIGEIRPKFVFVENTDALIRRGIQRVLGSLVGLGYDATWGVISSQDSIFFNAYSTLHKSKEKKEGNTPLAIHWRKRLWIVAHDSLADSASQ